MQTQPSNHFVNFSYRFAAREPDFDVYPWKSRNQGGLPWEGFEKAAWLHHSTGVPVTWMVDSVALKQAGRRLRQFADVYGDDIVVYLEAFARQPLYEELGVSQKAFGLRNYSYDDLCKIMRGYRKLAADTLGRDITVGAGYWWNGEVMRAARDSGFQALWGLCWDQQGIDGATHRGSPWFPYYASPREFKAPVESSEEGVLVMPWYRADLGNAFLFNHHPPFTTHTGELARWNLTYPSQYVQSMVQQGLEETASSPFAFTEFHLECDWMDSSGLYHDEEMSPATEVWAFQKACVAEGINPAHGRVTGLHEFAAWHLKNHPQTTRHELLWRDPLGNFPELRFTADARALEVSTADGRLVARQEYCGGQLGQATEGFLHRRQARELLCSHPKLSYALEHRLKMDMGSDELDLLNPNVEAEH